MINLTIDTCVWLELLKIDFNNEDNLFEELCFWIENGHLKHIAPENIIVEWNRNKTKNQSAITKHFKKIKEDNVNFFKNNKELFSTYQPDLIDDNVRNRIDRIDLILNTYSEKALLNDLILHEAAMRNLQTLAPNHTKDSFRDTVNILSLIHHLRTNAYDLSYFTTINYKDFCTANDRRHELHNQLTSEFSNVNLLYIYFGEADQFGLRLFNIMRKEHGLPNFQEFLKAKKTKEEEDALVLKKTEENAKIENADADYLENIKYFDLILAKKTPTAFDQDIIKTLVGRHDSYKQYFLRNIGNNGLV